MRTAKRNFYKGPQYKKRQREKLVQELDRIIGQTLSKYDLSDIKEDKPQSQWTILDYYIAEHEKNKKEESLQRSVQLMRGE